MSQSTSGTGPGQDGAKGWPFDPVGGSPTGVPAGGAGGASSGMPGGRRSAAAPAEPAPTAPPGRRRPPVWLLVVAAAAVVALSVVAVLWLGNRGGGVVPEAEVVTLPVPTPTLEPLAREEGTAFYAALPSTVLAMVVSESAEDELLLEGGALEGYRLVYTDGGATTVVVLAGQWATAEEAADAYGAAVAALATEPGSPTSEPSPTSGESPAADEPGMVDGAVLADGVEVGRYTRITRADGTATALWTNGTTMLRADGPAAAVLDLYTAFPL